MSDVISISECLKRLESGETVILEYYKYDRKRKKGGQIDEITCVLLKSDKPDDEDNTEYLQALDSKASISDTRKSNKRQLYIRKVRIVIDGLLTGVIRDIHPPLIRRFNGIETVP